MYNKTIKENTNLSLFCLVLPFCKAMKQGSIYSKFPFCNHLEEEEKAGCFAIVVLQMYCYYKCFVALPHGVVGWSAVCDCGIF